MSGASGGAVSILDSRGFNIEDCLLESSSAIGEPLVLGEPLLTNNRHASYWFSGKLFLLIDMHHLWRIA